MTDPTLRAALLCLLSKSKCPKATQTCYRKRDYRGEKICIVFSVAPHIIFSCKVESFATFFREKWKQTFVFGLLKCSKRAVAVLQAEEADDDDIYNVLSTLKRLTAFHK